MALDVVAPDPRYRATLDGYVSRLWRTGRDHATGEIGRDGMGTYGGAGSFVDAAGAAELLTLAQTTRPVAGHVTVAASVRRRS
jgi:hypothetical protein